MLKVGTSSGRPFGETIRCRNDGVCSPKGLIQNFPFSSVLQRTASIVCEDDISGQQSCPVCDEQLVLDEV
jgi:hypothetical protein